MKTALRLLCSGRAAFGLSARASAAGIYTLTDHLPLTPGYTVATC